MGFTRYWYRTKKPITQELVDKARSIVQDSESKGITIYGSNGEGKPYIELDGIYLNGNEERGLAHECLAIDDHRGFNFCKTACKPYDYTVREILKIAQELGIVENVSADEEWNEVYSDDDYFND